MGMRVIIRDHNGWVIGALRASWLIIDNPFDAEAQGLLLAAVFCNEIGLKQIRKCNYERLIFVDEDDLLPDFGEMKWRIYNTAPAAYPATPTFLSESPLSLFDLSNPRSRRSLSRSVVRPSYAVRTQEILHRREVRRTPSLSPKLKAKQTPMNLWWALQGLLQMEEQLGVVRRFPSAEKETKSQKIMFL
ncbi:uncharacterized protein LOC109012818 [Juglans regia]|uniref:Uncharacterized protein LOC109012818 n=1 Tax=Juglans regia TaxID=51240 RepID=A0A6P9ETN3_JUGRE|nr:uncharacterized protein LOC109012818 [Juglans regia]